MVGEGHISARTRRHKGPGRLLGKSAPNEEGSSCKRSEAQRAQRVRGRAGRPGWLGGSELRALTGAVGQCEDLVLLSEGNGVHY